MTREALRTAVREGIPFVINMADGNSYEVREEFKIALGATRVVVLDDRDLPHILSLRTMTGISYLAREDGARDSHTLFLPFGGPAGLRSSSFSAFVLRARA